MCGAEIEVTVSAWGKVHGLQWGGQRLRSPSVRGRKVAASTRGVDQLLLIRCMVCSRWAQLAITGQRGERCMVCGGGAEIEITVSARISRLDQIMVCSGWTEGARRWKGRCMDDLGCLGSWSAAGGRTVPLHVNVGEDDWSAQVGRGCSHRAAWGGGRCKHEGGRTASWSAVAWQRVQAQ